MTDIDIMKIINRTFLTFIQKLAPSAFGFIFLLSLLFTSAENLAETKTIWLEKYIIIFLVTYISTLLFAIGKIVPEWDIVVCVLKVMLDTCFLRCISMLEKQKPLVKEG